MLANARPGRLVEIRRQAYRIGIPVRRKRRAREFQNRGEHVGRVGQRIRERVGENPEPGPAYAGGRSRCT